LTAAAAVARRVARYFWIQAAAPPIASQARLTAETIVKSR
jgi:hypothetical protein